MTHLAGPADASGAAVMIGGKQNKVRRNKGLDWRDIFLNLFEAKYFLIVKFM